VKKIIVADTSAIIHGTALLCKDTVVTTPKVLEEVKSSVARYILLTLLEGKKISVVEPERKYLTKAIKIAKKMGYLRDLSETDISLIALAIKYISEGISVIVYTDDYKIQSILSKLNISYSSVVHKPIDKCRKKIYYCSICGKTYTNGDFCPICGSKLRSKYVKA